ncbi:ABC transporter ATP-binding protein [Photobacterium minamisatsumaniensis]|uniref:ABC transporter ATP-binding protein n=1 Tax=Photobacterium minamisatsumaniensis TaxID=2910233 RepID=UPI003D12055D
MTAIALQHVDKTYQEGNQVVFDVNMKIESGEFIVIVGPSGCGKSTLLRMIAGLEEITGGDLIINDQRMNDVLPQDRDLAFVFQNYALYPHLSVRDNIAFSLELRGVDKRTRHQRAEEVAKTLRLQEYLDKKPGQLSGGQRQRVAMGRAIARDAGIYLMDEPLSNLDAELRNSMRAQIKQLHRNLGNTTVYVTHDQIEALTLADKIAVMKGGVLQQFASPEEIYDNPANVFVASFIGAPPTNIMPLLVEGEQAALMEHISIGIASDHDLSGGVYKLGIRPDKMTILEASQSKDVRWQASVDLVETTGSDRIIHCSTNGYKFLLCVDRQYRIQEGETIDVGFNIADALLFDGKTEERIYTNLKQLEQAA